MRKGISGILMALLLTGFLPVFHCIQPVEAAGGTIYIRADGSVDPPTAPILNIGDNYYTLTANINEWIVIERSSIVFDGSGHTLEGNGTGNGIFIDGRGNVTIKRITVRGFNYGIHLQNSFGNKLFENNATTNAVGIFLNASNNNGISGSNVTSNGYGVQLFSSSSNNISSNNMMNHAFGYGIRLDSSSRNIISANIIKAGIYGWGVGLVYSDNNVLSTNTITNIDNGIELLYSDNNILCANLIAFNNLGVDISGSSNNVISANSITDNAGGIDLRFSSSNSVSANTITNNYGIGIGLVGSTSISISANTVINNGYGIYLTFLSDNNSVSANTIANSTNAGIWVDSLNNLICHNNFVNNTKHAQVTSGYMNVWDDGYPSGGNYWSNYTGTDANHDGIGDTPHVIDANNTDNYPLMTPWNPTLSVLNVTAWHWVSDTTVNSVAVGDVDGDSQKETVTGGSYYDGTRNVAQLIVWNSSLMPERLTTWYWSGNTTINSVALGDADGDSGAEIVTGGYYFDGMRKVAQLVVWNGSNLAVEGIRTWHWTRDTVINSVAVGDVDGDGQAEIVTGGYHDDGTRNVGQLVVWGEAPIIPFERVTTWYWTSDTVINSIALDDVDADGQVEIVTGGAYNDSVRDVAQLVVWNGSDLAVEKVTSWFWTGNTVVNSVAVGDVDTDGETEIVTGGYFNDGTRDVAQLVVWTGSALTVDRLTSWFWTGNTAINSVALGDVNGDAQVDIVTGGYYNDGTRNVAQLVVWNGSSLAVEYLQTWFWFSDTVINSVCLGDINGDFSAEIATGGAYYDALRWNAQLVIWGMRQTL